MTMYKTTYHRNGEITVWDVYKQSYRTLPSDALAADEQLMPTLTSIERKLVYRHALRHFKRVLPRGCSEDELRDELFMVEKASNKVECEAYSILTT